MASKAKSITGNKPKLKLVAVSGHPVNEPEAAAEVTAHEPSTGYSLSALRAELAVATDVQLECYRDVFRSYMDTVEREWRRRAEARELLEKQRRRAVVAASERIASGQLLVSEADTPVAYSYCGTSWKMTATAAARRGTPHLAGSDVCYAYGKPVPRHMVADDGLTITAAGRATNGSHMLKAALAVLDGGLRATMRPVLEEGEQLKLLREADNEADANAVAVMAGCGLRAGYLYRPIASKLAALLDAGLGASARVLQVENGRVNLILTGAAIDAALAG